MSKKISNPPPPAGIVRPPPPPNPPPTQSERIAENIRRVNDAMPTTAEVAAGLRRVSDLISGREKMPEDGDAEYDHVVKTWRTKTEADALDAVMTMVIQYACGPSADDLSIDTMGVRSVERVIDLLKEYGLVETVKLSLGERMIGHVTEDRINNERWRELDRYRAR